MDNLPPPFLLGEPVLVLLDSQEYPTPFETGGHRNTPWKMTQQDQEMSGTISEQSHERLMQPFSDINVTELENMLVKHQNEIKSILNSGLQDMQSQVQGYISTISGLASSNPPKIMDKVKSFLTIEKFSAQPGDNSITEGELQALRNDNSHLKHQIETSEAEINMRHNTLEDEIRKLEIRAHTAENNLKEANMQMARYRNIILSCDESEIDDFTIQNKFKFLKNQVQHIAYKFYQVDDSSKFAPTGHPRVKEFYRLVARLPDNEQRVNRLRGQIFKMVSSDLLGRKLFGTELFSDKSDIEIGLCGFERAVERHTKALKIETSSDLSAWRSLTIKLATQISNSFVPEAPLSINTPKDTAYKIRALMSPFKKTNIPTSSKTSDEYHNSINALAVAAFHFAILLRGCKKLYRIESPEEGTKVTEDLEIVGLEGIKSLDQDKGLIVAHSVSGALVKYDEAYNRIVLEKAHVVVTKA